MEMETTIESPPEKPRESSPPPPGPPNRFMSRMADDDKLRMDARWLARLLEAYGKSLLQANPSPGINLDEDLEPTTPRKVYVWQVQQARRRELAHTARSLAKELVEMCEMAANREEALGLGQDVSRGRSEERRALM